MPQNDSSPTIQISSLQFCESPLWDTTLLWNTVSPRFANCSMWLNLLFWSPASRLASQTLCWPTCPPSCCSSSSLLTLLSFPKVLPEMWASNNLPSSVLLFTGAMGLATEKSSIIDVLAVVAQPRWSDNFSPVSPISSATIVCPHRSGCPGCWISRQPDFKHCWQEPRTGECRTGNLGLQVISNLYQVTSGPQFFFWVSSSLCQALTLTSAILGPHTEGEKAICITQFLCQGQNGQLSSHPSLSDSPSLYWSSRSGRMNRLSMQILQVYAPKYLCEYNLPTPRSQSWQPLAKAHRVNPLQAVVWMVSFSFFTFRQCFDLFLSIWYEPY